MRQALLWIAGLAAVAGILYAATLSQAGFECEACMHFNGRDHCARAAAGDRDAAEQAAITAACAPLSGGVTDTIQCQATTPVSLRCNER